MTTADLRAVLLAGDITAHLHSDIALKAEDSSKAIGIAAVKEALAARPHLFHGLTLDFDGARATASGYNGDGLAVKIGFDAGLIYRIVLKRPDPAVRRIRMTIAYDGTEFFGFQRQADLRSVQAVLEEQISRVNDALTVINGASRTDTGVHAVGQVVHFDTTRTIPPDRWRIILNHSLPPELHVIDAVYAHPLFHSRFDVFEKEYRYTIDQGEFDPLRRRSAWFTEPFDVDILEREMQSVLGTHDFTSFCTGEQEIPIRTIREARVERLGSKVILVFVGEGFLHHMIRILAATLVRIAQGRMKEDIASLIAAKNRVKTKEIAPAGGLCLIRVVY